MKMQKNNKEDFEEWSVGCVTSGYPCGAWYCERMEFAIECDGNCKPTCPFHPEEKKNRFKFGEVKVRIVQYKDANGDTRKARCKTLVFTKEKL